MKNNQTLNLIKLLGIKQLFEIIKVHKKMLQFARNYMTIHCFLALDNIGFFQDLKKRKGIDINSYARENNLNKDILLTICDYLYSLNYLDRDANVYFLAKKGDRLLCYAIGVFDFVYAYAPLFENIDSLLRGEKFYGKDIFKREDFVAKASNEIEEWLPIPIVNHLIQKYNFNSVLDVGCGNAKFLVKLCRNPNMRGFGIDISEKALLKAQETIKKDNMESRIRAIKGDILRIDQIDYFVKEDIDIITFMFVLHEFLPDKNKIIILLKKIKAIFKSHILICELYKQDINLLKRHPTAVIEHYLFHRLSSQALATKEEWRQIFKQAGCDLVEEINFDFAAQVYFLLS